MPMITDSRAIPHILQVFSISSSSEHYIGLRSINQNNHKNHVWPCDPGSPLRPSRAAAEPGGYDSVTAFRQYALQESVGLWRARGLQKLTRSEERRVGKDCRCRRTQYDATEKHTTKHI